jgi:Uma2 family endonuclease
MSRQAKTHVTPEEYLAYERRAEYKNEYIGGEIFAMTGASRRHNLITANVISLFWQQLRDKPCEVYPSDMRVRIPAANVYTYPDCVVVCGEPQFEDAELDTLLNPTLIVEVLSKSTAAYDRRAKFGYYRTLDSLAEYILISQNEYHVAQHVRRADGRWLLTDYRSREDTISLESVNCSLPLDDVYDRVVLA